MSTQDSELEASTSTPDPFRRALDTSRGTQPRRLEDYRRRWAVVVGVRDYGDYRHTRLKPLANAVNDACLVYRILVDEYGFQATLLCRREDVSRYREPVPRNRHTPLVCEVAGNGTQGEICEAIDRIGKQAADDDLFVFFYAGHGTAEGPGFMLPYGAIRGQHDTYLMYETFHGVRSALPCKHQLLFFDCCYAGIAARGAAAGLDVSSDNSILLARYEAILAAIDSFDIAADSYLGLASGSRSNHSPFTAALAEGLESVQPGGETVPEALFNHIWNRLRDWRADGTLPAGIGAQPTIATKGEGRPLLIRPGLRLEVPDRLYVTAGSAARLRKPVGICGGCPPYEVILDGSPPAVRLCGHELDVDPSSLEPGEFPLVLRASDQHGLKTIKEITLVVSRPEDTGPEIVTSRLEPCFVGQDYRFLLAAEGGLPLLEWSAEGLPPELVLTASGEIFGHLRSLDDAGGRLSHVVRIEVKDSLGRCDCRRLRLVTVDLEEYCEVPDGRTKVGYHPTPERATELHRRGLDPDGLSTLTELYPQGVAELPRFFIKRYPVTQQEWRNFVAAEGRPAIPRRWSEPTYLAEREADLPVTDVAFEDMLAYCRFRGTRLPNGREWEKAARGEDGRLYPWGDVFDRNLCNNHELFWGELSPVDQFPQAASPYGVEDLVGNAWECVDQRTLRGHGWRQLLRGGSCRDGGAVLLSCFGGRLQDGWPLELDAQRSELKPARSSADPYVSFRDVVEVDDEPPFPQGLVRLARSQFQPPGARDQISTSPVAIARYAVSNEEYRTFVSATDHPPPLHWEVSSEDFFPFDARHLPVVNVSYSDAQAFCRWKTEVLGRQIEVVRTKIWQAAVHGPGGGPRFRPRIYPWGASHDPLRVNAADSGWGGTLRVFEIPEGRALCGAYHLVGNVFELVGPETAIGGSWQVDCRRPERWLRQVRGPSGDVGFRYFSPLLPEEFRR